MTCPTGEEEREMGEGERRVRERRRERVGLVERKGKKTKKKKKRKRSWWELLGLHQNGVVWLSENPASVDADDRSFGRLQTTCHLPLSSAAHARTTTLPRGR